MKLWWLSFCDPERPEGTQFLGACMVEGEDIRDATQRAWTLGINPGGEVVGHDIPSPMSEMIPDKWIGRLLSRGEVGEFDAEMESREVGVR